MTRSRPAGGTSRRYSLANFVGKWEPPHLGHGKVIKQALSVADTVAIFTGSANAPRRHDFVPFTAAEREQMIRLMFSAEENQRLCFFPVEDQGSMPRWTSLVRAAANSIEPDNSKITLIGHAKDHTSFYLKGFPGWHSTDVDNYLGLSSTTFRNEFFSPDFGPQTVAGWEGKLHPEVISWLLTFRLTNPAYQHLVDERLSCLSDIEKYGRVDHKTGKKVYGPHLAADFVAVFGDQILMIERKKHPFKGCLALPGGIVEENEDVVEAAIREAREETRIKLPEAVLRRSIIRTDHYATPFRDPRGRMVTFATLFHIKPVIPADASPEEVKKLVTPPAVKPRSDAKRAFWMPISEVRRDNTAFDHFTIIQRALEHIQEA